MKLDHIMYAANDLDAGVRLIESLTGVKAQFGGAHPGGGTQNALISFGREQYLEIIAPDPAQELKRTLGGQLQKITSPLIRTWAAAAEGYESLIDSILAADFGYTVIDMSRTRPDGVVLAWQILFVTDHPYGLHMPFFIDWKDSPHPSLSAPSGAELNRFTVYHPNSAALRTFFDSIDLEIEVEMGDAAMAASLVTHSGLVTLR